ncbi:DUF5309 domain-containing protein [Litorivivens sp.]|uniref:DUF5309 domain-containing protein n=2 Tax=Gammaproteobacteria TaxID=1236 RepID=UPI003564A767
MTQPTNTHDRYDLNTNGDDVREDLSDIIYNISPTETPFMSNAGRGTSASDLKEWLLDELADPDTANAHIDGDDFAGDALDDASRLGNYHQISKKQIVVSRRANKVNKAGRRSELAYQIAKKGKELKRDVEAILTGANQVAAAGNATTAPTTADLTSWLKTNTDRGATGADPALSNTTYGQPTTAATDGTLRALSEATLLGIIGDIYVEGGDPSVIMLHPTIKQRFSQYMFGTSARIATPYQDHGANKRSGVTAIGAVDVYVSDFGVLDIVPNRFQRSRDVFVLDMEYWEVSYLDGFKTEVIAKTGDSEKRHILVDYALCSKNEAASGIVADVDDVAMTA